MANAAVVLDYKIMAQEISSIKGLNVYNFLFLLRAQSRDPLGLS